MIIVNHLYLHTFLAVCEYANFTEAARQLFVPQPTVSNRIRYLEEELGYDLFVRGNKGKRSAELSNAGKTFYPYARQMVEMFVLAKSELNSTAEIENLINIASEIALTHPFVYEKINLLNNVFNKNINLLIRDIPLISKGLIDKAFDLAFVTEPIINKEIISHPLYSENIELCVSKKHPLAKQKSLEHIEDLQNEQLIIYKPLFKDQSNIGKIKCKKRIITNQLELIYHFVHYHNGVTLLPPLTFSREIEKETLVHIPINKTILNKEIQIFFVSRSNENFFKDVFLSDCNED